MIYSFPSLYQVSGPHGAASAEMNMPGLDYKYIKKLFKIFFFIHCFVGPGDRKMTEECYI